MNKSATIRFWLELAMAVVTGILLLVTLLWRNWIEIVFGVELDHGDGSLEWLIVATLFFATVAFFVLARLEWRKTRAASSQSSSQ